MKLGKYITIGREPTGTKPEPVAEKLTDSRLGAAFLDLSDRGLTSRTTISDKLLQSFDGWVYANVSTLAEEVSKIEFELYTTGYSKGELVFNPVTTHPILDLLDRWNPFTTTSEGIYTLEAQLELAGDTFLLLDNAVKPQNIFILQPDRIEIIPGSKDNGYQIKSYKYKYKDNAGKEIEVIYPPELVIQLKNPHPSNPLRGKSVVEAAAKSIDLDILVEEFLKNFFKNNATPGIVLSSDQRITKDDITRLEADLRRNTQGVKNAFKSLILGGGLKPTPIQSTLKDMMMLDLETHMRDKIMAMFKNTPSSLGIVEDVNRANAESSILTWKQTVIKPKMQRICDTLNEFLVPRYGDNLLLGFEDPVPEDNTNEIANAVSLKSGDIVTINEARDMLDMDPIEGGDEMGFQRQERQMKEQAALQPAQPKVPKALQNIDLTRAMRKQGIYKEAKRQKALYEGAREKVVKLIGNRPVKTEAARKYVHLSNEAADSYWKKQIKLTDVAEERFKNNLDQFLVKLEEKAVGNLSLSIPKGQKRKAAPLFDEEAEVRAGIDLFTPLQQEIAELSAAEAYLILNTGSVYVPSEALHKAIETAVKEFSQSFVGTDMTKLKDILTDGLDNGRSIAQIESSIRSEFAEFRKTQSQVIARTEILRASNAGAQDAYIQSGVVEGKQWYTAHDGRVDAQCEALDGKIVSLKSDFFGTDYGSGEHPPRHPRCRCVLLPVVKQVERVQNDALKKELADKDKYIAELEKLL
jgi:HK97 family phage portal protein